MNLNLFKSLNIYFSKATFVTEISVSGRPWNNLFSRGRYAAIPCHTQLTPLALPGIEMFACEAFSLLVSVQFSHGDTLEPGASGQCPAAAAQLSLIGYYHQSVGLGLS